MPPRIQLPADFKLWRLVCLGGGGVLIALGFYFLYVSTRMAANGGMDYLAAGGPAALSVASFVSASILIAPASVGIITRPVLAWFDQMFCPTETLRETPPTLIVALRQRLRDRQWESVTQQLDALELAYGPSPELSHLRAHLIAGQTGDFRTVTAAAAGTLSSRAFARYTALLRRDPPPVTIQVGIDA
jgi:hypothetical protein